MPRSGSSLPTTTEHPDLAPRSTPPPSDPEPPIPERRNIHDNDDFDRLTLKTSQLHFGRREKGTADTILADRATAPNKAAILSALAAFDSDDDERDDTYDAEDVGGTVDSGLPGAEEADTGNDEVLFKAYTSTPQLFERDALTRRSKERDALRAATNMTDESIEGWALMLSRDPRKLRKLEARYTTFTGQQQELTPASWRADDAAADDSDSRHASDRMRGGRGGFRGGRGRGRGARGAGQAGQGHVPGTSGDAQQGQQAKRGRARNEANKSSRANHSRREQRAKKMARGGFAG